MGCRTLLAAAFAGAIAAPAQAVTTGVVVANTGGKDTPMFRQWQSFRQALDEKSNGSILLDYLIFGEIGNTRSMADALETGRADLGSIGCSGLSSKVPELAVTGLPFLFDSDRQASYVFEKYLTPVFSDILAGRGLVLLQWGGYSWMDIYSRTPVQLPVQLEGREVRTIDNIVGSIYLHALGATPVILTLRQVTDTSADKIFGAMGTIANFVNADQPYRYFTRTHHAFNCSMIVANKAWFTGLSDADQATIRSALVPTGEMMRQAHDNDQAMAALLPSRGVTVFNPSAEEHNAWAAVGLPLYQQILHAAGGKSIEVYDAIRAGKQDYLLKGNVLDTALPK